MVLIAPGATILLVSNNKVLVYQRDNKPSIVWPDFWDLPGGAIEAGETAEQAVIREVEEECGLSLAQPKLLRHIRYSNKYADNQEVTVFMHELSSKEVGSLVTGSEGRNWSFKSKDEVRKLQTILHVRDIIVDWK